MSKPITPKQASFRTKAPIPDEVFDAFNELISENLNAGYAVVRQKDVVARILEKLKNSPTVRQDVFDKGWLNIEPMYQKAGWDVKYDKPGYNEDYEATFEFKARK
jgi:hypothetical protein